MRNGSSSEPLIPPGKCGGGKRTVVMREIVNGLMYILNTGCQWVALPKHLPPKSTVYDYFDLWSWDHTLDRIHEALYVACRELASREASPTAAIIDSQSVKSAGLLSAPSHGSDDAAGSQETGKTSIRRRSRFCVSPRSGGCCESYAILCEVSGSTLRTRSVESHHLESSYLKYIHT